MLLGVDLGGRRIIKKAFIDHAARIFGQQQGIVGAFDLIDKLETRRSCLLYAAQDLAVGKFHRLPKLGRNKGHRGRKSGIVGVVEADLYSAARALAVGSGA